MNDNQSIFSLYGKSPLYQLLVSILIILGTGVILFSISLLVGIQIFDLNLEMIEKLSLEASPKDINFLRYIMISQEISLFVIPAIIILTLMEPRGRIVLADVKFPGINDLALVVLLAFCIFPITSFTGQLNSGMNLPEWLSGVQQWMEEKEDSANNLIETLIVSDTLRLMILNLLIIAVLPAIGEELIFRGVLQKIGCRLFKSGHIAVWGTAFLFSALHFQFFGFIPRFILGLVFGYLFLWSGTLWLSVIAHFVNNAVPVIGVYFQGWDKLDSIPDISMWKQIIGLSLPVIISLVIMLYFRNNYKKQKMNQPQKTIG